LSVEITLTVDKAQEKKLKRNFRLLAGRELKIAGKAAHYAMTPVPKAAKQNAPTDRGALSDSLIKKKKLYKGSGTAVVLVGPDKNFSRGGEVPANYAHLVEGGVAPHLIPAPAGGLSIFGIVIKGMVQHPGYPGTRFLVRALEDNATTVVQRYRTKLLRDTDKEVRKLGAG